MLELLAHAAGREWRTRDDILGSVIRVDDRLDATLTGVFEDLPGNSTVQFDSVIPIQDFLTLDVKDPRNPIILKKISNKRLS